MNINIRDDRTVSEMETHCYLVVGVDEAMSGWGEAAEGMSYAAWACKEKDLDAVLEWVEQRGDITDVLVVPADEFTPPADCADLHIYTVRESHPAMFAQKG